MESDDLEEGEIKEDGEVDNVNSKSKHRSSSRVDSSRNQHRSRAGVRKSRYDQDRKIPSTSRSKRKSPAHKTSNHRRRSVEAESRRKESQNIIRSLHGKHKSAPKRHVESTEPGDSSQPNIVISVTNDQKRPKIAQSSESKENKNRKGISFSISKRKSSVIKSLPSRVKEKNNNNDNNNDDKNEKSNESSKSSKSAPTYISLFPDSQIEDISDNSDNDDNASIISVEIPAKPLPEIVTIDDDSSDDNANKEQEEGRGEEEQERRIESQQEYQEEDDDVEVLHLRRVALQDLMSKLHKNVNLEKETTTTSSINNREENQNNTFSSNGIIINNYDHDDIGIRSMDEDDDDDDPILLGDDAPYSPYSNEPCDEDVLPIRTNQSTDILSKEEEEEQIMFAKAREQWNLINSMKLGGISDTQYHHQPGQQQQYEATTTTSTSLMPEHVLKEQNYHQQENGRMTILKSSDKENTFNNEDNLYSKLNSQSFIPPPPSIEPFEFLRPYSTVPSSSTAVTSSSSSLMTPTNPSVINNNNDTIPNNINDMKDFLSTLYVPNLGTRDIDMRFPNYSGNPTNNILPSALHIPSNFTQEYQQQLLNSNMSQSLFFNTTGLLNQQIGINQFNPSLQQQQNTNTTTGGVFDFHNLMNPTGTGSITNIASSNPITSSTTATTSTNLGIPLSSSSSSMYANNFFNQSMLNLMSWPTYALNLNTLNPYLSANNINTEALRSTFQLSTTNSTPTPPPMPAEPILTTPPPPPPENSPPSSPIRPEENNNKKRTIILPRPPPPPIIRNFANNNTNDNEENNSLIMTKNIDNQEDTLSLEQFTEKSVVAGVDALKISDNNNPSSDEGHYRYDEPPSSPEETLNLTMNHNSTNSVPIISKELSLTTTKLTSVVSPTITETIKSINSTIKPTSATTASSNITKTPQTTTTISSDTPDKVIDNFIIPTSVPTTTTTSTTSTTTHTDRTTTKSHSSATTTTTTTTSTTVHPITTTTHKPPTVKEQIVHDVDDDDDMNSFEDEEILRAQLLLEISRKKKDPIIPISTSIPSSSSSSAYPKKLPSPIKPPYAVNSNTSSTTNTNLKTKKIITATPSTTSSSISIPLKTTKQFQLPVVQNIYSKDNRLQPYAKNNTITINNRVQSQLKPVINKKSKNLQIVRLVNNKSNNNNNNGAANIMTNKSTNPSLNNNNLITTSTTKINTNSNNNNTSINNIPPTATTNTTTTRSSPNLHNIQRTIINTNIVKKNSYNPNADTLMKHLKITVPNQTVTPLIIRVGQDESSSDDEDNDVVEMNDNHYEKTKKTEKLEEIRKKSLNDSNNSNNNNTLPILNIPKVQTSSTSSSSSSSLLLPSSTLIQSSPETATTTPVPTTLPESFEVSLNNLLKASREHSKSVAASSSSLSSSTKTTTTTNTNILNPSLPSLFEQERKVTSGNDNNTNIIPSSSKPTRSVLISNTVVSNIMPTSTATTISFTNSMVNENQGNVVSISPVNNNQEPMNTESIPVLDMIKQREELCLRERLLKATLLKKMNDQKDKLELRKMERSIVQSRRAINKELNTLLSDMVKISDIKRDLKDQQEKVDRLRNQLYAAENKLMLTTDSLISKETNRKSLTSRVFAMRKECVQLLKQCREQGVKIEGTNYKVPNAESLEMRSKLAEVRNQNMVFRRNASKNSPRKSLTSTPVSLKRLNNVYSSATLAAANRVKKFIMNRSRVGKRTPYSTVNFNRSRINSMSSGTLKLIKPNTPQQIRLNRRVHNNNNNNKRFMEASSSNKKSKKYLWLTKHGEYGDNYENYVDEENDSDEDQDVFLLPRMLFRDVMIQQEEQEKETEFGHWTSYQSPLISIRSLDENSTGVGRQIDPFITLCYFELRSACNSEKCHFQHLYRPSKQTSK